MGPGRVWPERRSGAFHKDAKPSDAKMKEGNPEHVQEAVTAVEPLTEMFSVIIASGDDGKHVAVDRYQLVQSLANNLRNWLFALIAGNMATLKQRNYKQNSPVGSPLKSFNVLPYVKN